MSNSTIQPLVPPPNVDRGPLELGFTITLLSLALLFIAFRLHARIFLSKAVGWDDYFAVASVTLGAVQVGLIIKSVQSGDGKHVEYLTPEMKMESLKYNFISQPFNLAAVGLQKISIAISLLRLNLGATYKTVVWFAIVPNVALTLTVMVAIVARCQPFQRNWNLELPGTCWPSRIDVDIGYGQAALNIFCNMVFVASPILGLAKVQLSKYNQWALRVIFLVGLFATICSIMKITYLPSLNNTSDFTWSGIPLSLWATGELTIGLMIACSYALKPRFEAFIRRFLDIKHLSTGHTKRTAYATASKYGMTNSRRGCDTSRSNNVKSDFDDMEHLKLDYYHKILGMPTARIDVRHSVDGNKPFGSENSSKDIIFHGEGDIEYLGRNEIRVTHTVEVQNQSQDSVL